MSVKLRVAGTIAVLVISGVAVLDAQACACGPNWASMTPEEVVSTVNQMPDQTRFNAGDRGYLPDMSGTGYSYAEDWTLVPDTYWYDPVAVETDVPGCYMFDVLQPNVSDELVDELLDSGEWFSVAGDGREALYNGESCW